MSAKTLLATVTTTIVLSALGTISAQSAKAIDFGTPWDTNCMGGTGTSSCSLQSLVNKITVSGPKIDTKMDSKAQTFVSTGGPITGSFLFSVSGASSVNKFGMYKLGDPNTKIELFGGVKAGITAGSSKTIQFAADGSIKVGDSMVKNFGREYGFYLERPGAAFYSQNELNSASGQQMVAYSGNDQTVLKVGNQNKVFDKNSVLIAFEDLKLKQGDRDYNDFAILVSGVKDSRAVPEPTALLSLAAIGGAAVLRRKQRKAD